jgi:hypothetical protein
MKNKKPEFPVNVEFPFKAKPLDISDDSFYQYCCEIGCDVAPATDGRPYWLITLNQFVDLFKIMEYLKITLCRTLAVGSNL